MTPQFTIRGLRGGQTGILGIWQPLSPTSHSFSTSTVMENETEDDDAEVVWSVSLPSCPAQAEETVKHQGQALHMARESMAKITLTLHSLPVHGLEDTAFALEQIDDNTSPEATLYHHLAQLQHGGEAVSFGPGWPTNWSQTVSDYQAFMQQVVQLLKPTLRVETQVEGVLHAYTRVGFSGDFETFFLGHSTSHYAQLHSHNLSLTLQSRQALLQLLAQTCTGAAVLAARFSLPGGVMMALPAAWRYLQDVMAQAKKLAQLGGIIT